MIKTKRDILKKTIVIPDNINKETFSKIKKKLKDLGINDSFITFTNLRYGCSIVIDKKGELSWYAGIVDNSDEDITLEEFLEE